MRLKNYLLFPVLLFALMAVSQRKEYRAAADKGTIESYTAFLKNFPEGKLADKAKTAIAWRCKSKYTFHKDYIKYQDKETIDHWKQFCPDVPGVEIAEKHLIDREWKSAKRANYRKGYLAFQASFPDSEYKSSVRAKLEELDWKVAFKKDNKTAISNFLSTYPKSHYQKKADSLLKAYDTYALPMAARRGDLEQVKLLVRQGANEDLQSRALMEAGWGALFTVIEGRRAANGFSTDFFAVRKAKQPRKVYIEIIKFLMSRQANPKRFAYQSFNSETYRRYRERAALRKASPGTPVHSDLGASHKSVIRLIPYKSTGFSLQKVAFVHKALDILLLIDK